MTARSALAEQDAERPARRPRGSILWVQGLACGAILTFAAPTALLMVVLFAPAIICMLAEPKARTGLTRAVLLNCAAAAMGPLWRLWMGGDHLDQALVSLSNPMTILLAWGAGACAWILCQILPVIISRIWDTSEGARRRAIETEIAEHQATWDIESA